jgi:hypothetical protein
MDRCEGESFMGKSFSAIVFLFFYCTDVAWMILGARCSSPYPITRIRLYGRILRQFGGLQQTQRALRNLPDCEHRYWSWSEGGTMYTETHSIR